MAKQAFRAGLILWAVLGATVALAGASLEWQGEGYQPVIGPSADMPVVEGVAAKGSLFAQPSRGGMFAPMPPRRRSEPRTVIGPSIGKAGLRDLIARAEAGRKGYDAVVYGARVQPPAPPTRLRLGDIYAWIEATPGQNHAIGRYQFIPATLRRLADKIGAPATARFTPALQDAMANELLAEAGYARFAAGEMSKTKFMNRLARIWAGLPTSSGRSHYHGFAGNKAVISWAEFRSEMKRLFPGRSS